MGKINKPKDSINYEKSENMAEPWPPSVDSLKFQDDSTIPQTADHSSQWNGKRPFSDGPRVVAKQANGNKTSTHKKYSDEHFLTCTEWWKDHTLSSCSPLLRRHWNLKLSFSRHWRDLDSMMSWFTCLRMKITPRKEWRIIRMLSSFHWSKCWTKWVREWMLTTWKGLHWNIYESYTTTLKHKRTSRSSTCNSAQTQSTSCVKALMCTQST